MSNATSLWSEFKSFAFKGNMLDLAVAVVIGAAFGKVIDSVVKDVIMPIVTFATPSGNYEKFTVWHFGVGHLLSEIINFVIIAFAVFITVVKLSQLVVKKATTPPPPGAPTTKECPLCLSMIPIKAVKCAHCTADLPAVPAV